MGLTVSVSTRFIRDLSQGMGTLPALRRIVCSTSPTMLLNTVLYSVPVWMVVVYSSAGAVGHFLTIDLHGHAKSRPFNIQCSYRPRTGQPALRIKGRLRASGEPRRPTLLPVCLSYSVPVNKTKKPGPTSPRHSRIGRSRSTRMDRHIL